MSSVVHVEIQQNPAHITVIPFKTKEKKNNNNQKKPHTNHKPNAKPETTQNQNWCTTF